MVDPLGWVRVCRGNVMCPLPTQRQVVLIGQQLPISHHRDTHHQRGPLSSLPTTSRGWGQLPHHPFSR